MKIRKISSILYFLFLSWLLPFTGFQAHAATYYVDPSGLNSNLGTQSQPWLTLQYAASRAVAGDTVLVNNGTYSGFYSVNSGTSTNPITFQANGSNIIVNSPPNTNRIDNINIEGSDYIIVDGFIVQNAPRGGIRVVESWGVIVRNNTVGPCGTWCIFTGFAPEVQVLNNKTFNAGQQHGIYVSNSRVANDNPIIRGNESYGNNWSGIQVNGDCNAGVDGVVSGAIIENNIVHDNYSKSLSMISMQNSVIQNNVIYNNGINGGAGGIHLTDEPGCGRPSNNNLVVNNTIIEPRIAGIRITDGAINNVIFNNLIVSSIPIADEVGNNNIDTTSNITRSSTTGLFVNPSAGDYHLSSNSPAIDAGRTSYSNRNAPSSDFEGTSRPQGSGYDVGYDEFGAGSGNASPTVTISSNNTSGNSPLTINFTANASDSDGTIARYEWDLDGNGVYEATTTSNTSSYTYNNTGTYNPRVRVTDNGGATATSSIVTITVSSSSGGGGGGSGDSSGGGGSGSGDASGGGGGCGFVKDINGKGQGAKGEGLSFIIMLTILLIGIALLRKGVVMKKEMRLFLIPSIPLESKFRDFLFLNGVKARFFLAGFTILILLTFFSYASAAIAPSHPRLILSSSKLSELRAKACYDASGNVISNCTPQASWTVLKNWADSNLNTTNSRSLAEYGPRHFALVYQITQNTQYADKAISLLEWFYNANIFNVQCSATQPNCGYYAGGASDPWHYSMRYLGVSVGLAYDWVYDRLTADQRTRFYTKMNGWIDVVLNSSTNGSNIWPGVNTGDNNFYYGHTAGIGMMAYATYEASGGNPNAQNYINLMTTRITDVITNYLEGNTYTCPNYRITSAGCVEKGTGLGKGGDWAEGWNYGEDSMRPFINLLKAIKTAEGINYLNSLNFFKETPIFYLSATKPNLANIYAEGDWTREATGAISGYSRNFMSMLADEFQGTQLSRQIQYWINNNAMPSYQLTSWASYTAAEEFLWYNSTFPQENYNTLPLINYASGTQTLIGRSGWSSSDTWFTFRSGGRWTSHGHNGQGHFNIYKYADLAVNPNSLNSSGCSSLCAESTANNAVVNNSNSSGSYPAPDNNYNAYWRADANIKNYEDANSYTYIVGDSTDIYQTEDAQLESLVPYDSGVSFNQRAFVYIKDLDQFVIYDIYNVKSAAVSAQKIWLMYSVNAPTITGDTARIDNGQGRLFVKTLLPLNPSITTSSSGGLRPSGKATVPRLEVSPTAQQTNNQFLHVLYPTATSTASMTDTVRVNSSSGSMVGTHIRSSSANWVVMFSSDSTGSNVTGTITYTITPTTSATKHLILNLPPSTNYVASSTSSSGNLTITLTPSTGGGYQSSSQGALYLSDAPSVVVTNPSTSGNYSTTASTISLSGTSAIGSMAAAGAVITSVAWSNDRGGSGTATGTTSWSISNIPLQSGQNIITVTATDSTGRTGSAVFVVNPTVTPPSSGGGGGGGGNAAPTVTLSANTTSGNAPLTVNFIANASDPDGTISQYEWDLDGNGTYEAANTNSTRAYTYNSAGTYSTRVRVTDNGGATASSSVTITVSSSSSSSGSGSGGDSGGGSGGGGGCGFVRDDGKGQKAKGEGLSFAIMLIIALSGIALAKRAKNLN